MNETNSVLYQREGSYIPRIAAVHDLCGYGKCSLGVAIPVLSAAGCDVCPVPTSLFSAHTKFPTFYMHDFLGAAEQVASIQRLYQEHPKALRVVDPVMGDGGKMYPTYTQELCDAMKSLVNGADILTPNLTEASILTGIPYAGQDLTDEQVDELLDALLAMGAKCVVLKGIVRGDGLIRNFVATESERGEIVSELLSYMLHGTGDLFASALLAAVMCGQEIADAVEFAGEFVCESMEITREQPNFELRGVSFETKLGLIAQLLRE